MINLLSLSSDVSRETLEIPVKVLVFIKIVLFHVKQFNVFVLIFLIIINEMTIVSRETLEIIKNILNIS